MCVGPMTAALVSVAVFLLAAAAVGPHQVVMV
jgi:hypothetical protein